jgi:hypothetical protein
VQRHKDRRGHQVFKQRAVSVQVLSDERGSRGIDETATTSATA